VWSPLIFSASALPKESLPTQECDFSPDRISENNCVLILTDEGVATNISDLIQKEGQLSEDNEELQVGVLVPSTAAEMIEEDPYVPDETQGHTDQLLEKPEEEILESSDVALQKIDVEPAEILPQIEIRLDGESIRITEFAELLGVRSYEILRDLIGLEIFAKSSDSITLDTANKISGRYGIVIVCEKSFAFVENPADMEKTAKPNSPNSTFVIKPGLEVTDGDWIRDSVLGLGRILKLHTHSKEPDRHRVWFIGQTEEGTIIEAHSLRAGTLGVIDKSMIPSDIRNAAPEILSLRQ